MNLPYIQSELFHELVSMEPLLKPKYRLGVDKWPDGNMNVWLFNRDKNMTCEYWRITPHTFTKGDQITAEINRIWDAIPAECKRDDILK